MHFWYVFLPCLKSVLLMRSLSNTLLGYEEQSTVISKEKTEVLKKCIQIKTHLMTAKEAWETF